MPVKPSDSEEEYFKKQEIEKLRKARAEATKQIAEQERQQLKKLHWMHCPKCGLDLNEVDYRGVKVDTCFSCGGMYLDHGEIDKVLEFEEPGAFGRMASYLFGN
jgi:hypothetical protein